MEKRMATKYKYGFSRKIIDRIFQWLIVRDRAPEHYYLLTVPGCKTGLPRTRPVALVEEGAQRWLVSPYGTVNWVLNARAAGQVTITRGEYQESFLITELPVKERALVLKQYITMFPITRPYFDAKPTDPVEAFIPEAQWRPVFQLSGSRILVSPNHGES
jgi:deazaflavin-dependent oxidoreductase (nitroreductase family)